MSRSVLHRPADDLVERLGPRPPHGVEAKAWDEAAARIDQHRAAFGVRDTADLFGCGLRWDDTARDHSYRILARACERLVQVVGRELEVEPPGLLL